MQNKLIFKISLFNLSLTPLYLIFIIQYLDTTAIMGILNYERFLVFILELLSSNIKILFFIALIAVGFIGFLFFVKNNNYNRENAKKFEQIESKDFDHLTFLSTYVLPLITFNLKDTKSFLVLIFLISIIGAIYIKSNLYYLNPTLLLFGYKIYKAKDLQNNVVLISNKTLFSSHINSRYVDLGNNIYFLKDNHECK